MELFAKITIDFKPLITFGKSSIWYVWQRNWDLKLLIFVVISLSVRPQPFSAIFNDFWNVKNIFWLCLYRNVLPNVANEQATTRRCSWEKGVPIPKGKISRKQLWRNSYFSKLAGIFPGFWRPIYLATFRNTQPSSQLLPAHRLDPKKGVANEN